MDTQTNKRLADLGARLEGLWNEASTWQRITFLESTAASKLAHLRKEVEELAAKPDDLAEHADAWLLLMGAAAILGHTPSDLLDAIRAKLEVNRKREWGEPDADGVVEHVRHELVETSLPIIPTKRTHSCETSRSWEARAISAEERLERHGRYNIPFPVEALGESLSMLFTPPVRPEVGAVWVCPNGELRVLDPACNSWRLVFGGVTVDLVDSKPIHSDVGPDQADDVFAVVGWSACLDAGADGDFLCRLTVAGADEVVIVSDEHLLQAAWMLGNFPDGRDIVLLATHLELARARGYCAGHERQIDMRIKDALDGKA